MKIGRRELVWAFFGILLAVSGLGSGAGVSLADSQVRVADAPHLELELDSPAYRELLSQRFSFLNYGDDEVKAAAELSDLIRLGQRNLDFLGVLNQQRPADRQLALTSPELQPGYPIEAPKESSPRILRERLGTIQKEIPAELAQVLWSSGPLPTTLTLSDEEYLLWARRVDSVYQGASRWTLQAPYLESYKRRRAGDVRGYYFLTHEEGWQTKLSQWAQLDEATRGRMRPWLVGICMNSGSPSSSCSAALQRAETEGRVSAWVLGGLPRAESTWRGYFELRGRRSDVRWDSRRPELMILPFKDPEQDAIRSFLVDNIEDEWRLPGWNLRLDFVTGGWGTTEIEFVPGATPHVNALGGSMITMDANQSLTEYGTRWTIRHEFGHVLGLPDCYIEFYDADREVMVSYQLDLSNLMCSRRGKLKATHFEELKKAYFR